LQDAEEIALLANAPNPENVEALRKRVGEVINRIQAMTERTQTLLAENEKLSQEVSALRQQRFGGEEADVRQAYPLMDAVARSEGWDDPEMDSYNVYARKPQP
jgi:regulator of replication initiation timing